MFRVGNVLIKTKVWVSGIKKGYLEQEQITKQIDVQ